MSHKGGSGAPIDWNDPEQAATQARIDVLRNMISHNPMSYSEKEELVRHRLADEQRTAAQKSADKRNDPHKDWNI